MKKPGILLLIGLFALPWQATSQAFQILSIEQAKKVNLPFSGHVYADDLHLNQMCKDFTIDFVDVEPASCADACDAIISVNASGGMPPYQVTIEGESCTGFVTVIVTDVLGCMDSAVVFIAIDGTLEILDLITTPATDHQANGSVEVISFTEAPPLTFSINGVAFQSSPVFNGLAPGSYCIYVSDANGCMVKSDTFWIENTTSTYQVHRYLQVFPNPASNVIYVQSESPLTLIFCDTNGKVLESASWAVSHVLDVSLIPRGIYFVRLSNESGTSVHRILLQ